MPRSSRKPVKKLPTAAAEVRRNNVLLERLASDFRLFGEKLSAVDGKVDGLSAKVDGLSAAVDRHSDVLGRHSQILDNHSQILDNHSQILNNHSQILGRLEPAVATLTSEFQTFKTALFDLSTDVKDIKERLSVVEARP